MQTRLPIFEDETFSDLLELGGMKNVNIKCNQRLKKSWKIEKKGAHFTLSLPQKLIDAPVEVKEAILSWTNNLINVNLSKTKLPPMVKRENIAFEKKIFDYLIEQGEVSRYKTYKNHEIKFRDASGVQYDLYELFTQLNEKWFNGKLHSFLRWGAYGSRTSYHSQFHDEQGNSHHLITIGGVYNHPSVPLFAVEAVLYHEMLHIALPPIESTHRRNVHHKAFREAEKEFIHYEKWQKWLSRKAPKLFKRGF